MKLENILSFKRPKAISLEFVLSMFKKLDITINEDKFENTENLHTYYIGDFVFKFKNSAKNTYLDLKSTIDVVRKISYAYINDISRDDSSAKILQSELLTSEVMNNILYSYKLLTPNDTEILRENIIDKNKILDIITNKKTNIPINNLNDFEIKALKDVLNTLDLSFESINGHYGPMLNIHWY